MELYTIGHMSRGQMLSLFLNMEHGTHVSNPAIQRRRVRAIRITPQDVKISQLTIDGERLPFKPLEAHAFKGVINVLTK